MSLAEDLDDFMLHDPELVPMPERFVVDNDDRAEWAARKLRRIHRRLDEVEALWSEQTARLDEWRRQQVAALAQDRSFFEGVLRDYMRRLHDEDPKTKSRALPSGVVLRARKQPDGVKVLDTEAVLHWAMENDRADLVRTKREVVMATLSKFVLADGEAVPGAEPYRGEIKFTVSVEGES